MLWDYEVPQHVKRVAVWVHGLHTLAFFMNLKEAIIIYSNYPCNWALLTVETDLLTTANKESQTVRNSAVDTAQTIIYSLEDKCLAEYFYFPFHCFFTENNAQQHFLPALISFHGINRVGVNPNSLYIMRGMSRAASSPNKSFSIPLVLR